MAKIFGKWVDKNANNLTHSGTELGIKFSDDSAAHSDKVWSSTKIDTISGTLNDKITSVGGVDEVEYLTVAGGDITNKYIALANTPYSASEVAMDIIGGTAQIYDTDYTVSGTNLVWDGLDLDGVIEAGDKMRVFYTYA